MASPPPGHSLSSSSSCHDNSFLILFQFSTCIGLDFAGMDEREIQKSYWIQHCADLSVEAMMLDSKASDLDKEERPEVTSFFRFTFTLFHSSYVLY
jgi:hypothetical protein